MMHRSWWRTVIAACGIHLALVGGAFAADVQAKIQQLNEREKQLIEKLEAVRQREGEIQTKLEEIRRRKQMLLNKQGGAGVTPGAPAAPAPPVGTPTP